jgi:hypothetical protein
VRPSERLARSIAFILCAASVVWAASLPIAPLVRAASGSRARHSADLPYAVGALICHQRVDRSFATAGIPWPVCARCAGLYLSAAAGVMAGLLAPRRVLRPPSGIRGWRSALAWAALPTLASWVVERAGGWTPGSPARAWLAVPLGAAVGAVMAATARGTLTEDPKT